MSEDIHHIDQDIMEEDEKIERMEVKTISAHEF